MDVRGPDRCWVFLAEMVASALTHPSPRPEVAGSLVLGLPLEGFS